MPGISYLADAISGRLSRFATSNYASPTPAIRIFDRLLDDMMILLSTPRSQRTMEISGFLQSAAALFFSALLTKPFFCPGHYEHCGDEILYIYLAGAQEVRVPPSSCWNRKERTAYRYFHICTLAAEWIVPFVCARCFATTAVSWSVSSRLRWLETLLSELMAVMEDLGSSG